MRKIFIASDHSQALWNFFLWMQRWSCSHIHLPGDVAHADSTIWIYVSKDINESSGRSSDIQSSVLILPLKDQIDCHKLTNLTNLVPLPFSSLF